MAAEGAQPEAAAAGISSQRTVAQPGGGMPATTASPAPRLIGTLLAQQPCRNAGARSLTAGIRRILTPTTIPGDSRDAALPGTRRRSSQTTRSRLLQVGLRIRKTVPAMLAEEVAYGHAFMAVPVLIALGAALWFTMPAEPALIAVIAVFSCAIASLLFARGLIRYLLIVAALSASGMLLAALEDWRRATIVLDQPVTTIVTGVVETREPSGAGRWRYVVALENTASPVLRRRPTRVALLSRVRQPVFQIGDRITGRARISPPSGPALPGLSDFAFSSYFDGIGAIGFFYGAPALVPSVVETTWSQGLERTVFAWRSAIASRIRDTVPGDAGAFAAAIVTDERRAISAETTEALRVSGLAHIVAISGLNMALAAGIFFVGMRSLLSLLPGFAQAFPVKKLAAGAALAMATGYYLISGFGVSAERAYIMMAIMLVAVFFDRPSISLRNVGLAALVVLVISPSEILGPSFQMSFAATVALVAGYSAWSRRRAEEEQPGWQPVALKPVFAIWQLAIGVFATSLIGGLSTAIFSIDHFHRMSTYGLAANLAAMPLVSFIVMPFGLVGMLLMPFGLDAPFLKVMGLGLEGVIVVAKTVAGWGGDVAIGRQPEVFLPLATAGFLVLTLMRSRLHVLGLPILALALFIAWQARRDPQPDFMVSEDGSLAALLNEDRVTLNRTRPPGFIYSQWRHALSLKQAEMPVLLDIALPEKASATSPAVSSAQMRSPVDAPNVLAAAEMPPADQSAFSKEPDDSQQKTATQTGAATTRRLPLTPDQIKQAREAMQKALLGGQTGRFTCAGRIWCITMSANGPKIAIVEDARFAGAACDVAQLVVAARARFQSCRSGAIMINGEALRRTGALEIRFNGSANSSDWTVVAAMKNANRFWQQHRQYDWRRNVFDPAGPGPLLSSSSGEKFSDSGE